MNSQLEKNIKQVRRDISKEKNRANKLKVMAMNKAIVSARSTAFKSIRDDYAIKEKDLRNASKLIKATRNKLNAQFGFLHSWVSLGWFKTRKRKEGIEVRIRKSKGTLFKGTFIRGSVHDARNLVLKRKGAKQYPIKALTAPSAGQMFVTEKVQKEIEKVFWQRFKQEFQRLLHLKDFNVDDKFE